MWYPSRQHHARVGICCFKEGKLRRLEADRCRHLRQHPTPNPRHTYPCAGAAMATSQENGTAADDTTGGMWSRRSLTQRVMVASASSNPTTPQIPVAPVWCAPEVLPCCPVVCPACVWVCWVEWTVCADCCCAVLLLLLELEAGGPLGATTRMFTILHARPTHDRLNDEYLRRCMASRIEVGIQCHLQVDCLC